MSEHPTRSRPDPSLPLAEVCALVEPAFTIGGSASRDELLWTAMNAWAPADAVTLLMRLPDRYYWTVDDVREQLEETLAL